MLEQKVERSFLGSSQSLQANPKIVEACLKIDHDHFIQGRFRRASLLKSMHLK
jgi:hypothetical protein